VRKRERKLKIRISVLEIENGLLRADLRRFIQQHALAAQQFSGVLNGELTTGETSLKIATEVALEAAIKLCHIATDALDVAAQEIAEFTGEHIDDAITRLYDCDPEEWENLSNIIRACDEFFRENDEQGFTE